MRAACLVIALCTACRAGDHAAADAAADAPDIGCTASTPRATPPETFIGPTGLQARLDTEIDSAQHTLDVQMYLFTVRELADRLVAAKARGVAIRAILDPGETSNATVHAQLTQAGIPTVNSSPSYTFAHAKYFVIDRASVVIMSMNFDSGSMTDARNYGLVDTDPEDVADVQSIFDYDFALGGGGSPPPPDLSCTRLIVSPDNSQQRLNELMASAHTSLAVEALYVTDTNLRNAIGAAKQRGADVRVILEDPSDQAENADTATYLVGLGVPVHYATTAQFYLHAKLVIADGVVFVGSENMSSTSLQHNREVGELVFEPTPAAPIQQQFEADWTATPVAQ